jgi:hypothetical protein
VRLVFALVFTVDVVACFWAISLSFLPSPVLLCPVSFSHQVRHRRLVLAAHLAQISRLSAKAQFLPPIFRSFSRIPLDSFVREIHCQASLFPARFFMCCSRTRFSVVASQDTGFSCEPPDSVSSRVCRFRSPI